MKKIEVNHYPDVLYILNGTIALLWALFTFTILIILSDLHLCFVLSFIFMFITIDICHFLSGIKTIVEYDTETIRYKWLRFKYTVNLSEIKSVYYTIVNKTKSRDRCLEIVFNVHGNILKLNDLIKRDDIEKCISGRCEDIELMKLYKLIENICPEKSKGFVKFKSS